MGLCLLLYRPVTLYYPTTTLDAGPAGAHTYKMVVLWKSRQEAHWVLQREVAELGFKPKTAG